MLQITDEVVWSIQRRESSLRLKIWNTKNNWKANENFDELLWFKRRMQESSSKMF
jgi:hypothetical protein